MQITIEVPSDYYEGEWFDWDGNLIPRDPNKALEVLSAAKADWKQFAFDMADIIGDKLHEMSEENAHLEKCYDL